ncbi:patatin-like phospholipase family protein, partial [bacterium]|nr:patatin-like phospholipase family protein [bacterium]
MRWCIFLLLLGSSLFAAPKLEADSSDYTYNLRLGNPRMGRVWRPPMRKGADVALVLSGGGARGLSQIGVLDVLDENGIRPGLIVGVSMGAVVGGLYAAGYSPAQIEDAVRKIEWNKLIYDSQKRTSLFQTQRMATEKFFLHLRFSNFKPYIPSGISAAQTISSTFAMYCASADYAAGGDFDMLPIPFRAVSVDLKSGRPYIFRGGNLAIALRASSAIPLLLAPIEVDSALLADGGLVYPIPVEVAAACSFSKTIAVDATAEVVYSGELNNAFTILDQTTNIMAEGKKKNERRFADVLIQPNLEGHGSYDFSEIDSVIEAGRDAALDALPKIENIVGEEADSDRRSYAIAAVNGGTPIDLSASDSASLRTIKEAVEGLYSRGIYSSAGARLIFSGDSVSIDTFAEENPPLVAIKISGMRAMSHDSAAQFFDIDPSRPANLRRADSTLAFIEDIYRSEGYSLAHVSFAAFDAGTLGFIFDEGIVERVDIRGNKRTKDWVVRSFTPIAPGDRYDEKKLEETLSNLRATNLFESTIPRLARGDSGAVLALEVAEKPYFGLRLGARYDLVNNFEGAIEAGDDNLFGIAWRLNVGALGGERRWDVYSGLEMDRIWKTYLTGRVRIFAKGTDYDVWDADSVTETYGINRYGVELSAGQQIRRFGTVFVKVGSEYVAFGLRGHKFKEYHMNRLTFLSIVDTFDDRQFPHSGKYHEGYFTVSKDILGGEYSFAKS